MNVSNANLRAEYPAVAQWIEANFRTNEFARSLLTQAQRKGYLSDRQIEAVQRNLDRPARTEAVDIELPGLVEKFEAARANGLKRLKLRLEALCFSLAGENSANAGCIYVKDGPAYEDLYLGKITGSKFYPSRDCSPVHLAHIKAVDEDVLQAAINYGRETGECACCGRELTNPESIELGIGPICRERWGL